MIKIHRLKPESYYWLVVRMFWLALTITVTLQVNRALTIWETDKEQDFQISWDKLTIQALEKVQDICLHNHYGK